MRRPPCTKRIVLFGGRRVAAPTLIKHLLIHLFQKLKSVERIVDPHAAQAADGTP